MSSPSVLTTDLLPTTQIAVELPAELTVHPSGFFTDETYLYAIRRAVASEVNPADMLDPLYNGRLNRAGQRPLLQATEGHGLYVANHRQATRVPGIKGGHLYGLRIALDGLELLDSFDAEHLTKAKRVAAGLHRIRGIAPGLPNPGPSNWDKLYGDSELVIFPPMAIARMCVGYSMQIGELRLKPRWGVLRNPARAEIVSSGILR